MNWFAVAWFPVPLAAATVLWCLAVRSGRPSAFFGSWIGGSAGLAFGGLVAGDWITALGGAVTLIVAVIAWWLNRRKRKRSLRAIGGKARALLAKVVAKAREAGKPRVLRPVPQGAGA